MSKFLRSSKTVSVETEEIEVTVKLTVPKNKIEQVKADLQTIVSKATADEINTLRKVCDNSLVKAKAISEAKKYV